MVKSLGKSIINMYSMGACSVLEITNQEALSEDLENDLFLNSALHKNGEYSDVNRRSISECTSLHWQ